MSKDFPFTTYDFYAYLASGLLFLFSVDLIYTGGLIFARPEWNFVQIAIVVAAGYISGQILAIPSSAVLEHFLFNWIFYKPLVLQTGSKPPRIREKILSTLIGRYYHPLSAGVREKILSKAKEATGKSKEELLDDVETIFQPAFTAARQIADTCARLDDFRNQYGFARNVCFTGIVIAALAFWHSVSNLIIWSVIIILIVGMFLRFAKFYAAFCAEVLRSFAFSPEQEKK